MLLATRGSDPFETAVEQAADRRRHQVDEVERVGGVGRSIRRDLDTEVGGSEGGDEQSCDHQHRHQSGHESRSHPQPLGDDVTGQHHGDHEAEDHAVINDSHRQRRPGDREQDRVSPPALLQPFEEQQEGDRHQEHHLKLEVHPLRGGVAVEGEEDGGQDSGVGAGRQPLRQHVPAAHVEHRDQQQEQVEGQDRIARRTVNNRPDRRERRHRLGVGEAVVARVEHVGVEEAQGLMPQSVGRPGEDPDHQRPVRRGDQQEIVEVGGRRAALRLAQLEEHRRGDADEEQDQESPADDPGGHRATEPGGFRRGAPHRLGLAPGPGDSRHRTITLIAILLASQSHLC